MHPKVLVKLKKSLKTLSSGQKNPKKPKKNQKTPPQKKNPLGWVFLKKPGFFPTLVSFSRNYGSLGEREQNLAACTVLNLPCENLSLILATQLVEIIGK
jgi:hypothetical protein